MGPNQSICAKSGLPTRTERLLFRNSEIKSRQFMHSAQTGIGYPLNIVETATAAFAFGEASGAVEGFFLEGFLSTTKFMDYGVVERHSELFDCGESIRVHADLGEPAELMGERDGFFAGLAFGYNAVDQAHLERFLGMDAAPGEDQVHRVA